MKFYLENIKLSEVREKTILYNIIYMWNLKNDTNECIVKEKQAPKQKQTHPHWKQTCGYQRREGRGKGQVRDLALIDINH